MENNFICVDCEKEFFIEKIKSSYVVKNGVGVIAHKDRHGNLILCPNCLEELKLIEKNEEINIHIGKFGSSSIDEKMKILKKRSKEHNSSNEMKEQRKHLIENTGGGTV